MKRLIAGMLVFLALAPGAFGEERKGEKAAPVAEGAKGEGARQPPPERISTSRHTIMLRGEPLAYTATAGLLPVSLKASADAPSATIFYVAYVREGGPNPAPRPVTFAFNGGPGASSVWLHMGAMGPRTIAPSPPGPPPAPPYALSDNQWTWLDQTDLVFIDPVGTGFSRAAKADDSKGFYDVEGDIRSVAEFIRLWVTRNDRWRSPKFIAGESYGTVRTPLLAERLLDSAGMAVNGLVLISSVLNMQALVFGPGNDLPCIAYLPTYAAAAAYHGKSAPDLRGKPETACLEAEEWALGPYADALARGDSLPDADRERAVEKLVRLTGLRPQVIRERRLRVPNYVFGEELLREENRSLGILDSRYTRLGRYGDIISGDPSSIAVLPAYVAAVNDYLRKDLGFAEDIPYEYFSREANRSWKWGPQRGMGFLDVLDDLRDVLQKEPFVRVFIASGHYDLDAPYFGAVWNVNHLGLDPSLRSRVTLAFYEAGHQMYTDPACLPVFRADVAAFMRKTLPGAAP